MGFIHLVLHVLNFLAPAGFVALLLPAASRHVLRSPSPRLVWWVPAAIQVLEDFLAKYPDVAGRPFAEVRLQKMRALLTEGRARKGALTA